MFARIGHAIFDRAVATRVGAALLMTACLTIPPSAHAALTLNATGLSLGFSLSTFATGDTVLEHYGAAALGDGTLIATYPHGQQLLKYTDADGQNHGTALAISALTGARNVARVDGVTYAMSTQGFFSVANNLTTTPLAVTGLTPTWGFAANPVTGHLLAGTTTGIWDIDPLTGTKQFVSAPTALDGIAVSADGQTVYAALENLSNPGVAAYTIATGAQQFFAPVAAIPHGVLVIRTGPHQGRFVVINHDGTVGIMKADGTGYQTIATGGVRGVLGSPDLNDGSGLLAFDDDMYRLRLAGGSFGVEDLPEPASLLLLAGGLVGVATLRRRQA